MLPYCDIHLHSNRSSDGSLSVHQLLSEARKHGIGVVAITDHNTYLPEDTLVSLRQEYADMTILSGCEFSTNYKNMEVHIIGLNFHPSPELEKFLESNKPPDDVQRNYINTIIKNLRECSAPIAYEADYDALRAAYPNQHIGRATLAKDILAQGLLPDSWTIADIFNFYIGDYGKRVAYAAKPCYFHDMTECVGLCRRLGGMPILAHPMRYRRLDIAGLSQLIEDFAAAGGLAVEVYRPDCIAEQQKILKDLASGLLFSAGSDFHRMEDKLDNYFSTKEIYVPMEKMRQLKNREEDFYDEKF